MMQCRSKRTRILVTGGRDYVNVTYAHGVLEQINAYYKEGIVIIQGGAKGADRIAKDWALKNGVPCITMDAAWDYYEKRAGSVRNKWMIDICAPDFVLAFPGGIGTANMIKEAERVQCPVYPA